MGMEPQMLGGTGLEPPPQFKEEPPESWQVSNYYLIYYKTRFFLKGTQKIAKGHL